MSTTKPAGHYSPYVRSNGFIFTSGQLPIINRETNEVPADIKEQTHIVLQKVEALLQQEGLDRTAIVKTTAFITDIAHWPAVNEAYIEFFGDHKPARSIIPTPSLNHGCKIELEAIASIS